jgi:preprotein translocase SecF subunit
MEFFRETHIDFISRWKLWVGISWTLILAGVISFAVRGGPRYSVDFTGGTVVELRIIPGADVAAVRAALDNAGVKADQVTTLGTNQQFLVSLPAAEAQSGQAAAEAVSVRDAVAKAMPDKNVELRRQETVGPKIGKELRTAAVNSIVVALLVIMVYVWVRFPSFQYALGAVVATLHDVLITAGIFSLLNKEFTLAIVAALLTIVGFSVNDTIVVFDRVRENMKLRRKETFEEIANRSVNETLSRTIITSGTVLITSLILMVMGGSVIHDFALAMSIGIIVGTYSSIYVASPIVIQWYRWRAGAAKRVKKAAATA